MKSRRIPLLLSVLTLLWLLIFITPAQAQTPEPPPPTPTSWTGEITGRVVNQTEGGELPAELTLMLHVWDENFQEKLMRDTEMQPDGSFVFSDIPFEAGLIYGVMTTYKDVLYFAQSKAVEEGQSSLTVEVPIAELTTDASLVEISRAHLLFAATPQGLSVTEVLGMSNLGDRTVKDAIDLPSGGKATLVFPIPPEAINPIFRDDPERYVLTDSGFADLAPLTPGANTSQIVVSYELPYEDGLAFTYTPNYPLLGLILVIPEEAGIDIEGEGIGDLGVRTMPTGEQLHLYEASGVTAGETLSFQITGQLQAPPQQTTTAVMSEPYSPTEVNRATLIGLFVFAFALIFSGLWWRRRLAREPDIPDDLPGDIDDLIQEIALLDEAHERGEYDEDDYSARRAALISQIRQLLAQAEAEGETIADAPA